MPEARMHYQDQLDELEKNCMGGIDLVVASLDRTMEAVQHQDMELAELVIADDDRIDGRYLEVHQEILTRVDKMGALARSEVGQAKQAFALRDMALAEDLVRQDEQINRLNREIFRLALDAGDDSDVREWAMHMILVARALERIGDNAVDVGEQTAFVVTGLFREFSDASHVTKA